MRGQLICGQAVLLVALSLAIPTVARAERHQPPAHAQANGHHKAKKAKHDHSAKRGERAWDRRFQGLDRDDNRVVTRGEWNGDDRSFNTHDWNRDGMLSGDELIAGATRPTAVPRAPTPPRPTAAPRATTKSPAPQARTESDEVLFARRDTNRDGRVTPDEFPGSRQEFDRLDANRDGALSPYEYGVGR